MLEINLNYYLWSIVCREQTDCQGLSYSIWPWWAEVTFMCLKLAKISWKYKFSCLNLVYFCRMFREKYDFDLQPTTSKGYWVRDFSVWPIRSEPFRSGPFRSEPSPSGPFRSGDISVWAVLVWEHFGRTIKPCRNLTCSHFNANILKSTKSFI